LIFSFFIFHFEFLILNFSFDYFLRVDFKLFNHVLGFEIEKILDFFGFFFKIYFITGREFFEDIFKYFGFDNIFKFFKFNFIFRNGFYGREIFDDISKVFRLDRVIILCEYFDSQK
jgi:hypothetical protein